MEQQVGDVRCSVDPAIGCNRTISGCWFAAQTAKNTRKCGRRVVTGLSFSKYLFEGFVLRMDSHWNQDLFLPTSGWKGWMIWGKRVNLLFFRPLIWYGQRRTIFEEIKDKIKNFEEKKLNKIEEPVAVTDQPDVCRVILNIKPLPALLMSDNDAWLSSSKI